VDTVEKLDSHKWVMNREFAFWSDPGAWGQGGGSRKKIAAATKTSPGDRVVHVAVSGGVEPFEARAAHVIRRAQYKILDAVVVEINVQGKSLCASLDAFPYRQLSPRMPRPAPEHSLRLRLPQAHMY
jgi:hypothetical protein